MGYLKKLLSGKVSMVPTLLAKAVPVSPKDFESGEMARVVQTVSGSLGFVGMGADQVMSLLATGFGYSTWAAMRAGKGQVATDEELPQRELWLQEVIAWRMFRTGQVGLREAQTAVYGAFAGSKLGVCLKYGDLNQLEGGEKLPQDQDKIAADWADWKSVELLPSGKVRLRWAGEMAWCAATLCWQDGCGIEMSALLQEINRGAEMTVDDLVDDSWMHSGYAWPFGMDPVQYEDGQGGLIGYGWTWDEIGMRSARVFGSKEALKASAIRLWRQEPIEDLAVPTLPEAVVQVEFKNPWDKRDLRRAQSDEMKRAIALELRNKEQTPWMEVLRTDGSALKLGRDVVIAGDRWTGVVRSCGAVPAEFANELPSMEEVRQAGMEVSWMKAKVPFAMKMADYETVCRVWMAIDTLRDKAETWLTTKDSEYVLSGMLMATAKGARAGISRRSAAVMEEPFGTVKGYEVPTAGAQMEDVYPELAGLQASVRGEYALGFYGKDGIRHHSKHTERDRGFMAYAILRNIGVDVTMDHYDRHLVLLELARKLSVDANWNDQQQRDRIARELMGAQRVMEWVNDLRDDVEGSLEGESRLVLLGLAEKEEARDTSLLDD